MRDEGQGTRVLEPDAVRRAADGGVLSLSNGDKSYATLLSSASLPVFFCRPPLFPSLSLSFPLFPYAASSEGGDGRAEGAEEQRGRTRRRGGGAPGVFLQEAHNILYQKIFDHCRTIFASFRFVPPG